MSKKLVVTQSNYVVNAAYKLSLNEQRVVLLILSKIESRDTAYNADTAFTISAKEFSQTFGIPLKSAYVPLMEAGDHLMERKLTLPIKEKRHYIRTQWVSDVEYNSGEGSIKLNIAPKMLPLLTQLQSNFTTYQLAHTAKFKSAYSHRIYQFLIQWKSIGKVKIDLAGFRQRLMLTEVYDQYKYLKSKILIPSLKEINKYSDLKVELLEIKQGRQVVEIQFMFTNNKTTTSSQKALQINFKTPSTQPQKTKENFSLANTDISKGLKKIREETFKDLIH